MTQKEIDHIAESGKKVERAAETAQNTSSCARENDVIFRQAAIEAMGKAKWARERLEDLPSAQLERARGHWIVWGGMDIPENHGRHKCSLCGEFAPVRYEKPLIKEYLSDFCPNCGADMRGGERRMIEQETVDIMRRIEALKCSETPKSSEQNAETAQNVKDGDSVFRQAAIDCVTYDVEHTIECLKALPSAQPDIIRCKDCKHWRFDHTCREHSLVSPMMANEFCSRAERREG